MEIQSLHPDFLKWNIQNLIAFYPSGIMMMSALLTDNAISYMENRFKSGIAEVTKHLANLVAEIAINRII